MQGVACLLGIITYAPSAWLPRIVQSGTLIAMVSCTQCDGLMESLSFDKPREYLELARRLLNSVNEGTLNLAESTCSLQDLFKPEWPNEIVEHNLECTACGRSFQLFADTFHGHAGWGVTGPQTKEPALAPIANS